MWGGGQYDVIVKTKKLEIPLTLDGHPGHGVECCLSEL